MTEPAAPTEHPPSAQGAPTDAERRAMWDTIRAAQPRFGPAVAADLRVLLTKRGEPIPRSRLALAAQLPRLALVTDAFLAQVCYRARVHLQKAGIPLLPRLLQRVSVAQGQVCIGDPVLLEPGIYLPHGQVVIDGLTTVHATATLSPFVTLGRRGDDIVGPTIGAGASIGTGAKVLGPVVVGAHAQVGANAVVIDDVPAGATAVGVPARVVGSA